MQPTRVRRASRLLRVVGALFFLHLALSETVGAFDPPPLCIYDNSAGGFSFSGCDEHCSSMSWWCDEYCTNPDADFSACRVWDVCSYSWGDLDCTKFENSPAYGSCTCGPPIPGGGD